MEVSEIIGTNKMLSMYIVNIAHYWHLFRCVTHFFNTSDVEIFWKQNTVLLWLNHQQSSLNHPNGPGWTHAECYEITWSIGWCVNIIGDLILFEYLIFEVKLRQEHASLQLLKSEILFSWWLGTKKDEAAKTLMHNNWLQMSVNMFC